MSFTGLHVCSFFRLLLFISFPPTNSRFNIITGITKMSLLLRTTRPSFTLAQRFLCSKGIPKNLLEDTQTAVQQQENGAIFDKKAFKITLEKDKVYSWCLCGKSKSQPICDGTHKNVYLKIKLRPIRFKVEKTGDYWLCNCKQTKHRPFCDGTHKQPHIQSAVK